MSEEQDTSHMAAIIAALSDQVAPIREATIGYRQSLIDMGMGKDAADRCAADFHGMVMDLFPKSSGKYGRGKP